MAKIMALWLVLMVCSVACAEVEITDTLIAGIIQVESGGKITAIGRSGERGVMQISEIVLAEFRKENKEIYIFYGNTYEICEPNPIHLFNEDINKAIGKWYLERLRDYYGCQTLEQILSAYNGGIGRLKKVNMNWTRMPRSTIIYVERVLGIYYDGT